MRELARRRHVVVYDLYAPLTLEQLALDAREERSTAAQFDGPAERADAVGRARDRRRVRLRERAAARLLARRARERGPARRPRVRARPLAPHARSTSSRSGSTPSRPRRDRRSAASCPGIGAGDRILLWPGGIWNWFDPLTVIRAVARPRAAPPDLRLYFLGIRHPTPGVPGDAARGDGRAGRRARRGARAPRPRSSSSTTAGSRTRSAGGTCSTPTSPSRPTSTTSRRGSRSGRDSSTASGRACLS